MIDYEKLKIYDLELTQDMIIGLLRGKPCNWIVDGMKIRINPPNPCISITHRQYGALKATSTNINQDAVFYEIEHDN